MGLYFEIIEACWGFYIKYKSYYILINVYDINVYLILIILVI